MGPGVTSFCELERGDALVTVMSASQEEDELEHSALALSLLAPRTWRLDVLPFAILYLLGFGVYFAVPSLELLANICTPVLTALHVLTFLTCHWSLSLRCALQLRTVRRAAEAVFVRATPASGRSELCKLERRPVFGAGIGRESGKAATSECAEEVRFEFRKRTYLHTPSQASDGADSEDEATLFQELTMPLNEPLSHYVSASKGLKADALLHAQHKYGENSFEIPKRSFGELFVEHALAPFFVFQVFCVLLWSLDDYWCAARVTTASTALPLRVRALLTVAPHHHASVGTTLSSLSSCWSCLSRPSSLHVCATSRRCASLRRHLPLRSPSEAASGCIWLRPNCCREM